MTENIEVHLFLFCRREGDLDRQPTNNNTTSVKDNLNETFQIPIRSGERPNTVKHIWSSHHGFYKLNFNFKNIIL